MTIIKNLLCCFILLISGNIVAQKATLSGKIIDANSNETLIGVSIYVPEIGKGAVTNEYGYYSLSLPLGNHKVIYSYIGFDTVTENIIIESDVIKNILLIESTENLEEVVIEATPKQISISKPEMSTNKLSIKTIKEMPVVLGETDVIKSLLQLPGVTSAGEGASGFNVRGGAADQNLILLDEVNLFSSSHLFGLFSIFNPDAVKDLKLYKAGIPARYGGRISSVLDIYQKDGNYNEYHAQGGIGLLSSRLLIEGPIKKEKTSFLAGGRSSYAHLFLPLFDIDNQAYFYDLNLKVNHIINDNNKLYLSSYFGKDVFSLEDTFANSYGNKFVNLRWNHLFNNKLFSNLSAIYSNYFYNLQLDFVGFVWNSGIDNVNLKYDLVHYLNDDIKLRYGTNQMYYHFNPGKIEPINEGENFTTQQLTKKYAFESAYYTEAEIDISSKINIGTGLRLSTFNRLGQDKINIYQNNEAVIFDENLNIYKPAEPIDTYSLSKGKTLIDFYNFEPRFNIAYELNEDNSLKASYQRTAQYIHLISNTSSPTPLDVWVPSGNFIEPQKSDQYAFGWFTEIQEGMFSLSLETYYKEVQNRINYIDGADIVANDNIETVLLNGQNRAYGVEFLLQKNKGRFKGWLAYTLAKTEDQVPGRTNIEPGINNGNWFNANYDKTHDLSLNGSYKLNKKWSFSAAFNYQTGIPANFPVGQYTYNNLTIPIYGNRNADRLPAYHRLDLAATLTPSKNSQRKIKGEWVFGIYNLYNRMNATSITFAQNEDTMVNEATKLSLFGIVPSISYNFKF